MKAITLLTDFGLKDPYVGVMKGVILSINPDVHIVDITHEVEAQDLTEGCFVIKEFFPFFAKGSIHVCVVDPTVGSDRRGIVLEHDGHFFVGPDNGLFSLVIDERSRVYEIENRRYMLKDVSNTFHGRDIFAPVGGHLSLGLSPAALGKKVDDPLVMPELHPRVEGHVLTGKVVRFDRFGNALSNISADSFNRFAKERPFQIRLHDMRFETLNRSYFEDRHTCVIGSSGYLEFGLFRGNLSEEEGIKKGDEVTVTLLNR